MTYNFRKAGIGACLFLCAYSNVVAFDVQQWTFEKSTEQAYIAALNLQFAKVHVIMPQPVTPQEIYVASLAEAMELLLEEDGERYTEYEDRFEKRKERKTKLTEPDDLFLQAEMAIQWAFVYFKFGHEFDAALNLRDAYSITTALRKRYPSYVAIKKTAALLEVIIGSVPEKYNWVLSLLNIEGSVDRGLYLFESIHNSKSPFMLEADLLHAMVECYILQQPQTAVDALDKILIENTDQPLTLFLGASLAIKNSQSEKALAMLDKLEKNQQDFKIDYADYMRGEIFLYKAEYLNSITAYRTFIANYKGQNNIKDANYKVGLCYLLNGNTNDAIAVFKQAKNIGKEVTEGDKYAARSMAEAEFPHLKLTKARYFIDGGYYDRAKAILDSMNESDLPTQRDQVEYYYRKARLEHKENQIPVAKENYMKVIDLNGDAFWYFAPNACLQLGYIFAAEKNIVSARTYFERALSYKNHEYKNSIDTKARSALAQIKPR